MNFGKKDVLWSLSSQLSGIREDGIDYDQLNIILSTGELVVGSLLQSTDRRGLNADKTQNNFQTNFIAGKSRYLVVEACEYRRSFLNIEPDIAVITNIDNDHLDYYKDIKDIQNAFGEFTKKVPEKGYIVCDEKDTLVREAIKNSPYKVSADGKSKIFWASAEEADASAEPLLGKAKIVFSNQFKSKLKMKIPGEHNLKNAEKALAVAHLLEIDKKKAIMSLEEFSGTWRRFEFKGETDCGTLVYDDYGHHPTEIKATLKGAREFFSAKGGSAYGGGGKKIVAVFQPHLFSRTKLLLNDFAQSFKDADEIILAPIYPAREAFDPTISSDILAEKIREHNRPGYQNNHTHHYMISTPFAFFITKILKVFHLGPYTQISTLTKAGKGNSCFGTPAISSLIKEEIKPSENQILKSPPILRRSTESARGGGVHVFSDFLEIEKYLKENLKKDDVLITIGAGDIYKISENLVESKV
ncbi:MAG: Mur ligase family protein [Candidatus Taylorbacteria bacterium]|nr:Mur ligase family protein [Candidatus Taylorbacteria bacterium]